MTQDKKKYLVGHRERLRQKLLSSSSGQLPDYEILELLLSLAIHRIDVKPLAKELINRFGSMARAINASEDSLMQIKGVGSSVIAVFRTVTEAASRLIKEQVVSSPILGSSKELLNYCRATMGHITTEKIRIFYLDNKNMLILDELQESGTIDHISFYPREIIKKALHIAASAIIIAHNHPSANITPSKSDIDITKQIIYAAHTMGIEVHDHLIISNKNYYSFKANGLI